MFRIQEVTVWVLPIFLCKRESFRDTYEPFFQFGNQDCRPSWTSTLWRGDQDSCITVTHKSHLVSQDCLIFLLVYVSHFALFCIQNTFQDPYLSPKLSLIWFIPIQQADSCPASCVCPAHRRKGLPGPSPLLLILLSQRSLPFTLYLWSSLYSMLCFLAFGLPFPLWVKCKQLHCKKSKKENKSAHMETRTLFIKKNNVKVCNWIWPSPSQTPLFSNCQSVTADNIRITEILLC